MTIINPVNNHQSRQNYSLKKIYDNLDKNSLNKRMNHSSNRHLNSIIHLRDETALKGQLITPNYLFNEPNIDANDNPSYEDDDYYDDYFNYDEDSTDDEKARGYDESSYDYEDECTGSNNNNNNNDKCGCNTKGRNCNNNNPGCHNNNYNNNNNSNNNYDDEIDENNGDNCVNNNCAACKKRQRNYCRNKIKNIDALDDYYHGISLYKKHKPLSYYNISHKMNKTHNKLLSKAINLNSLNKSNQLIIKFIKPFHFKSKINNMQGLDITATEGEPLNISEIANAGVNNIINQINKIISDVILKKDPESLLKIDAANGDKKLSDVKQVDKKEYVKTGKKRRGTQKIKNKSGALWSKWSEWSTCSVSCGRGKSVRWRKCLLRNRYPLQYEMEQVPCSLPDCSPFKLFGLINL